MQIVTQGHAWLVAPGPQALAMIEAAARTCYKSEGQAGCQVKVDAEGHYTPAGGVCLKGSPPTCGPCDQADCPNHSAGKIAGKLVKNGHHAMLEFADATIRFVTNRGVTHEMVRHRLPSFAQESTRFCDYAKDGSEGGGHLLIVKPVWVEIPDLEGLNDMFVEAGPGQRPADGWLDHVKTEPDREWLWAMLAAEQYYRKLRELGWPPEYAREVLPNSLKTEIVMKANLREWMHVMSLRAVGTTGKPHPQMRDLMLPVLMEFAETVKPIFGPLKDAYEKKNA